MATCYVVNADTDGEPALSTAQAPCSNSTSTVQCCNPSDTCGADGFCYFTHALASAVTGYYLGGCTDPDFEDPACSQHCTGYPTQDVIYSQEYGLWSCCYGSGELDCRKPSNETFALPGPDVLFGRTTSAGSSTATSSTSSHAGISTTTTDDTVSVATSKAATTSASAGKSSPDNTTTIAVAVAVPVLVILAAIAGFWFWRRRRRGKSANQTQPAYTQASMHDDRMYEPRSTAKAMTMSEMPVDREPSELYSDAKMGELPGDPGKR